jgi:hypothetical protein
MYKIRNNLGHRFKSYNIQEIGNIITSNPSLKYDFFINYKPITHKEFLEIFIKETQDNSTYMNLIKILKAHNSIIDFYEKQDK